MTSASRFFWAMYRDGDILRVHERLLVADTLVAPFDPNDPYGQIGPYSSEGDDGQHVSEWTVTVEDLQVFLERRKEYELRS